MNTRASPRTHWSWWPMAILAFAIAAYALSFYARRSAAFPPDLRESFLARPWGIYTHVLFGAIGLAIGPFQFRRALLLRRRPLHRRLGVVYVFAAAMTGIGGMYMALYSFGGLTTHLGFGLLGFATLMSAVKAYFHIRAREVAPHREWMIRSYALIFGAVMLRIWLPLLMIGFRAFEPAYAIVSWLAWVPNLIAAEWYIRRSRPRVTSDLPVHSRALAAS